MGNVHASKQVEENLEMAIVSRTYKLQWLFLLKKKIIKKINKKEKIVVFFLYKKMYTIIKS